MTPHRPPTLDMTVDGRFQPVAKPSWTGRILVTAILVAALAGAGVVAALALWFALALLPVVAGAALVAYLAFRYRMWRAQRDLFRGQRDLTRPL